MKYDKDLASIVAYITGDGHLQIGGPDRFDFISGSKRDIRRFEKILYKKFKVVGKIRPCTTNIYSKSFLYGINNKKISIIIHEAGTPEGRKTDKKFLVPKWIIKDKIFFKHYVRSLYDCEGCVDPYCCIELKMYKREDLIDNGIRFFKQIKNYLKKYYDIDTNKIFLVKKPSVRKDGTIARGIILKIRRQKSIIKYMKNINFNKIEKKIKLEKLVESFKK